MNLLVLSADRDPFLPATGRLVTSECTFFVSIDGGPSTPAGGTGVLGPATVVLPPGAQLIEIQVTPTSADYWPLKGLFAIQPDGTLVPASGDVPAEFEPSKVISVGGDSVVVQMAHLSRLKDVTQTALQSLTVPTVSKGENPATWPPGPSAQPWPPAFWDTPPLPNVNYIQEIVNSPTDTSPIQGGAIFIAEQSLDPNTVDVVLQLANVKAPKTIAVSWPNDVLRTATADPTPFLVYFHATVGQALPKGFYENPLLGAPYPFNFDYVFYGLWRYMNYNGTPAGIAPPRDPDPLTTDPYAKGLPYQMAASGKNAVIVLPCNRAGVEVGVMTDAAAMDGILREIQSYMFRRAGIYTTPGLGRVALAAFSAANLLTLKFLNDGQNQKHQFYQNTLQELYMFGSFKDNAGHTPVDWINSALTWAQVGAGKMVRAYLEHPVSNLSSLVAPLPSTIPFVATSGLFTAAVLNIAAWHAAATSVTNPNPTIAAPDPTGRDPDKAFQDTHQLISAMMLVDALSRSGF